MSVESVPDEQQAEVERIAHGICDALQFLPSPRKNAGTAILLGLLKGTAHEGHRDDEWSDHAR